MKRTLFWKALAVGLMALGLLIPLALVQGVVSDRKASKAGVEENVAASSAGRQQVVGPLLVLTHAESVTQEVKDEKTGKVTQRVEEVYGEQVIVPKELQIKGSVTVEERYRGIYKAQVFHLKARLQGQFRIPARHGMAGWPSKLRPTGAYLVMGVSDVRGLTNRPVLDWGGQVKDFQAGVPHSVVPRGIQVALERVGGEEAQDVAFDIPLELAGTGDLSVAPVAENTRVELESPWKDPSFGGRFLPTERTVTAQGFKATWQIFHLARNLDQILNAHGRTAEAFDVAFLEPVNIYLMTERAVKYGLLFVGLTFGAFFFFEVLKRLRIHPMQYLLVGLALAFFFLLLISLTEHIPFVWAYLAAAGASILLIAAYMSHALQSRGRGLGLGAGLTVLYGVLYGLLSSEDNALLMGSLLLFGALGAVMMATRKLDWYTLAGGERTEPQAEPQRPQP